MVSWYTFTNDHDAEALVGTLQATWSQMGVSAEPRGKRRRQRAALRPGHAVDTYKEHHFQLFAKLEEEAPS